MNCATPADLVVAADGSGTYTTVTAAITVAPSNSHKTFTIHEFIIVPQDKPNITLISDGLDATVENSVRPKKEQGQAVAIRPCALRAFQDTGQENTITTQGRASGQASADDTSVFNFQSCTVAADNRAPWRLTRTLRLMARAKGSVQTFLGRPWLPWENELPPDTIFYTENDNNGPGAATGNGPRRAGRIAGKRLHLAAQYWNPVHAGILNAISRF
ncbi:hypothetical protein HU200_000913 [Digitaria exilis]|uniref:Pectinesterase catalytic domain-containing protein n=1 Tax=Digitaria exilis TaxID=1010633 RepID=A0A835FY21_9POAL|nr:hypothetical protein HU200_000913 [Digitaria exilis]